MLRQSYGIYARTLYGDDCASRDDVVEAIATLEELDATTRRVYGTTHPVTEGVQYDLELAQEKLATFDASPTV